MSESPFMTINKVLTEESNGFDDLRMIAKDQKFLSVQERHLIKSAADELEISQRTLVQVYGQLVETQQKLIAVNDKLIAANRSKASVMSFPGLQMTIGLDLTKGIR